ncbi:MAG: DUF2865 domain-containing protein [Rhizobiaceae bacterium]
MFIPTINIVTLPVRLFIAIAVLLAFGVFSETAHAQSNSCSSLRHQLASLSRGSDGGSAKYRRAAKAQKRQISRIRSKMSGYGCTAKRKFFSREKHPSCRGLRSTLIKMKRNLSSLQRKAGGSGSKSKSKRRRIVRAMRRNRCGKKNTRQASVKRTTILEQIFGSSKQKRRRQQAAARKRRALRLEQKRQSKNNRKSNRRNVGKKEYKRIRSTEDQLRKLNYNTVRTICVRTCDGYFFPVSFSTNKQSIRGDASACSNLCPGTEMKLYYHKTASQSTEQMISRENGKPYTSLPTAFAYQKSYNPSCSCNYRLLDRQEAAKPETVTAKEKQASERRVISRIAKPNWRVDRGQDPETLANAKGDFNKDIIEELDPTNGDDKRVAENRKVRVVGDAYFPNQ